MAIRRNDSKEAYRLWYEFLRRAIQRDAQAVDMSKYAQWGDVANTSFTKWWQQTGWPLVKRNRVEIVRSGTVVDESCLLISVPKSLTATDAGNIVRKLLLDHYAQAAHKPKRQTGPQLTEGKEIKVRSFRAYLVTYDAYQRLLALQAAGKLTEVGKNKTSKLKLPAKLLLDEVRKTYAAKRQRYSKGVVKVDSLPNALADTADNYAGALRAISRYAAHAEAIVRNVARGDFPGTY